MLRSTICCRCLWFRSWCPSAKKYELLPLLVAVDSWACAKKHDLWPLFVVRSGAPVLRRTIYWRYLWFSNWWPQCPEIRIVAVVCGFEVEIQC